MGEGDLFLFFEGEQMCERVCLFWLKEKKVWQVETECSYRFYCINILNTVHRYTDTDIQIYINIGIKYGVYIYIHIRIYEESGHSFELGFLLNWMSVEHGNVPWLFWVPLKGTNHGLKLDNFSPLQPEDSPFSFGGLFGRRFLRQDGGWWYQRGDLHASRCLPDGDQDAIWNYAD